MGAYIQKKAYDLQSDVYGILLVLVTVFDEEVAAQIEEREQFLEYVDATEILIEKAKSTAQALEDFLMKKGYVIPPSILEHLQDAHRELFMSAAYAESGRCGPRESADRYAHDGVDNLQTALRKFQDHLDIKKAALG